MAPSRPAKWIFRAFQLLGALTVFDGAFRLATLIQAHSCGLNRFEPNDGFLVGAACLELAAGSGTLRCKSWGRSLMLACVVGRLVFVVFQFYLVLRVGIGNVDALGWVLMGVMLGFFAGLIVLLVPGWRRLKHSGYLSSSTGGAIAMWTSLLIGIAFSLLQRVSFEEAAVADKDLEVQFLREVHKGRRWTLYRALTDGTSSLQSIDSLKVLERDGNLILVAFPPRSRCHAILDPARGTLSIGGHVFSGQPFEGAPQLVGHRQLNGLSFSKAYGPISGDITLAVDPGGNFFVFLDQLSVYGKSYEGIYIAPFAARP